MSRKGNMNEHLVDEYLSVKPGNASDLSFSTPDLLSKGASKMNQLNPRGTNVVIDDELAAQQKAVADAKAAQVKARKAALTAAFKESVTEPVVDETTGEVTSEGGTQYVNVER